MVDEKQINRQVPIPLPVVDIENIEEQLAEEIYAKELVCRTFDRYAAHRTNIELRWTISDELLNGVTETRYWKGTQVKRASYPQPIVSDQFRTILPALEQAIFPDSGDSFSIGPAMSGSTIPPQFGRMLTNTVKGWLEESPKIGLPSGRREILNALMDAALYKLGCVHVQFNPMLKRPVVEAVNIKDIYLDPKAPSPSAEDNKCIIWRKYLTVKAIKEHRDSKGGFKKISDDEIYGLCSGTPLTSGVTNQNLTASLTRMPVQMGPTVYDPSIEDQEIEVLIYYSEKRIVWILNRTIVFYNEENIYKFFPFCFTPFYPIPHRNYGESIGDILESTQRLSEGLVNNTLDTLHMATLPPRTEKQMSGQAVGDRWYPGLSIKASSPKDDVIIHDIPLGHITPVWDMVQWLQQQGYSRTGQNPLQQGGIPTPSNANRTASGMNIQMSGGSNRLYAIVKQFEDYMFIPLIKKMLDMCRIHVGVDDEVEGFNENGDITKLKGIAFHIPFKLDVQCASRVISKAELKQILPDLIQYFTQGTLIQQLQQTGRTVDVSEILSAVMDASGLARTYAFVRDMSQQEMQAMQQAQQPKPDPNMVAKIQMESQARMQETQLKGQIDIQKEQIKQQPNPWELQAEQMKAQMDMAMKQKDLEMKQMKLEMDAQKAQMDIIMKQMELRLKGQEAQMDMEISQRKAAIEMRQAEQKGMIDTAIAAQGGDQKLRHTEESHQLKQKLAAEKKPNDTK